MVYDDSAGLPVHVDFSVRARAMWAERLRELRVNAGNPPLRALSRRTGIPPSSLSEMFNARTIPSWGKAVALIEALGGAPAEHRELYEDLVRSREPVRINSSSGVFVGGQSGTVQPRFMTPSGDSLTWLFEQVPESIGGGFRDAWHAYMSEALVPSFAAVRWVLEAICVDQKAPSDISLSEKLQFVRNRDVISEDLFNRTKFVIRSANDAVHKPGEAIDDPSVGFALKVLGAVIAQVYVVNPISSD